MGGDVFLVGDEDDESGALVVALGGFGHSIPLFNGEFGVFAEPGSVFGMLHVVVDSPAALVVAPIVRHGEGSPPFTCHGGLGVALLRDAKQYLLDDAVGRRRLHKYQFAWTEVEHKNANGPLLDAIAGDVGLAM